ncbi:hypothetical protein Pcinc_033898 [Petrolisthes cinctipes]|uniref:Uncharacterized protein n=1 Tax=Petrolisthes cinctipes TaxID=88211 RepID=A0AAE1ER98_PETCI|nr:hypothetical protein Pcinc_033898 [Petrolisthes cinctipes]
MVPLQSLTLIPPPLLSPPPPASPHPLLLPFLLSPPPALSHYQAQPPPAPPLPPPAPPLPPPAPPLPPPAPPPPLLHRVPLHPVLIFPTPPTMHPLARTPLLSVVPPQVYSHPEQLSPSLTLHPYSHLPPPSHLFPPPPTTTVHATPHSLPPADFIAASESVRRETTVQDDGGDSAIKFLQTNKHWIIVGVVAALLLLTIIQASITIHKAKKNKSPPTAPAPGAIDTGSRVALVGAGNGRGAPPPYDPASAFQSSVSIPSHTPSPSGTPLSTENPGFIAD